ncbi:MAG: hypothetical protein RL266_150 [Bacteroidota bacterium]|jgi:hypothetical protein
MSVKVKLKNREDKYVVLDDKTYEDLQNDTYLSSIKFLENLRAHSNGYGVFQRCITTKKGPVYETIYLHKHVAEKFVKKPKSERKLFVRFIDGDVLNVQLENLEWVTMNTLRRQMKNFKSKTGFRGVTKEKNRFRAVIYHERKAHNLGFFDTAEEAAIAYNKKSRELFGETGSLNRV